MALNSRGYRSIPTHQAIENCTARSCKCTDMPSRPDPSTFAASHLSPSAPTVALPGAIAVGMHNTLLMSCTERQRLRAHADQASGNSFDRFASASQPLDYLIERDHRRALFGADARSIEPL